MQTASRIGQSAPLEDAVHEAGQGDGAGRILLGVFDALDQAGIRTCVLHGYRDFPRHIPSDVDCLVDATVDPARLAALLHEAAGRLGAEIVLSRGRYFVLAGKEADSPPCFLTLDMSVDYTVDDLTFYRGDEVLATRRRHGRFWTPAPRFEFGGYLARSILKRRLDDPRWQRLSELFQQDPGGCEDQVARFWNAGETELIVAAARSGDWTPVRRNLDRLRGELRRRAVLRHPASLMRNRLAGFAGRIGRLLRPEGVDVVLLGPDGAGKSSVVDALGPKLEPAFARSTIWGFVPPVFGRLRSRGPRRTDQPHALKPRSLPISIARAGYWFVYYTLGYLKRHLALARSTLVLNDRHFVDILVDQRRYRYGGPAWLLRLVWGLIPKPDLVNLLDAPA
jgi:hypothetical protein